MKNDYLNYSILLELKYAKKEKTPITISELQKTLTSCIYIGDISLPTVSRRMSEIRKKKLVVPKFIFTGRNKVGYIISKKGEKVLGELDRIVQAEYLREFVPLLKTPFVCDDCEKREKCKDGLINNIKTTKSKKKKILEIIGDDIDTLKKTEIIYFLSEFVLGVYKENKKLKKVVDILEE